MRSILDLIGQTPLVKLNSIWNHPKVDIYAKLEGQNPGGSVKDRAAYNMIRAALHRGDISSGDHLVEATSGNTGIALAMVANQLGLKMTLIMPESATEERKKVMKAYGAKLIETPKEKTIEYSRTLAKDMSSTGNYFLLNQFANNDNWKAHYNTTGPELWKDTNKEITHFVSSMGTTGTIMGVSRYLKEQKRNIQIIGGQPTNDSKIPGIRRWTPEFLPKFYEVQRVDRIIDVSAEQAILMTQRLATEESIFAGMSSGGACHIALNVAKELDQGVIVFIACDRGDRYLSSDLFQPKKK